MNTFHVLEGILAVKIRSIIDPVAKAVTAEALERIRSMSLVHQKLFAMTQHLEVDLDVSSFLSELADALSQAFASVKDIKILLTQDTSILLSAEKCTSLGLLMVELVLNAIKHAFYEGESGGVIQIKLQRERDDIGMLSVSDNGKGLHDGVLTPDKGRLGARFIQSFVTDLKGDFKTRNQDKGAEFFILFPLAG